MEKLNSDEKMSILMNLDGNEIVRVCSTSKNMGRICSDDRYSPLWKQKILQEFNEKYTGSEKGYDRYKFLRKLHNTEFFILIVVDKTAPGEIPSVNMFDTFEKSVIFVRDSLQIYSYSQIKSALNASFYIETEEHIYILEGIQLTKIKEDYMKEDEKYVNERRQIKILFGDKPQVDDFLENTIREFNSLVRGLNPEDIPDEVQDRVTQTIQKFIDENNLHEHADEVELYIRKNILIPY